MRVAHPTRPKSPVKDGEPLLELEDVRVAYGGIKALKGVSMKVFPGEIVDIPSYLKFAGRLNSAIGPHVVALLTLGTCVVLDFPGNTRSQRAWFRQIFEEAGVDHELHFIDAPEALCKRQLKERSQHLPPGTPWTTEAEFDMIMAHFLPPAEDERFNVIRHDRDA